MHAQLHSQVALAHGLLDTVDTTVLVELAVVEIDCANVVTLLTACMHSCIHR